MERTCVDQHDMVLQFCPSYASLSKTARHHRHGEWWFRMGGCLRANCCPAYATAPCQRGKVMAMDRRRMVANQRWQVTRLSIGIFVLLEREGGAPSSQSQSHQQRRLGVSRLGAITAQHWNADNLKPPRSLLYILRHGRRFTSWHHRDYDGSRYGMIGYCKDDIG